MLTGGRKVRRCSNQKTAAAKAAAEKEGNEKARKIRALRGQSPLRHLPQREKTGAYGKIRRALFLLSRTRLFDKLRDDRGGGDDIRFRDGFVGVSGERLRDERA